MSKPTVRTRGSNFSARLGQKTEPRFLLKPLTNGFETAALNIWAQRPMIVASYCVVLPSYREGAPRTLIEAAAMDRPLIATDVPGCRAVMDHEKTGFLCDVRSADSLATAMRRFLNLSVEQQNEMGRAGRAKMEREYDKKLVVEAYSEVIHGLNGKSILPMR